MIQRDISECREHPNSPAFSLKNHPQEGFLTVSINPFWINKNYDSLLIIDIETDGIILRSITEFILSRWRSRFGCVPSALI